MPAVQVVFYCEPKQKAPVLEWLRSLQPKPRAKALTLVRMLAQQGHELHRPYADILRDDIRELRAPYESQQNRILYFFHGQEAVVLALGLKKEAKVPEHAIKSAIACRDRFRADPEAHTYEAEQKNEND